MENIIIDDQVTLDTDYSQNRDVCVKKPCKRHKRQEVNLKPRNAWDSP